jgi:hypothetical protein
VTKRSPLELWTILIVQSMQPRPLDKVSVSMLRIERFCHGSPPIYKTCDTIPLRIMKPAMSAADWTVTAQWEDGLTAAFPIAVTTGGQIYARWTRG